MIVPFFVHNTEIGAYIDSDNTGILGWLKLCNAGLVISEFKKVRVKYESLYASKKL